jgi:hypothetical protein
MPKLLTIDSRDRADLTNLATNSIRILIDQSITFRKISLIFMDLPVDEQDVDDEESCYYMSFAELGNNVRGCSYADQSTFILIRASDLGYRSMSFENESYTQELDLGSQKTFSEFNITLRYRKNAAQPLQLVSEWSCILRYE